MGLHLPQDRQGEHLRLDLLQVQLAVEVVLPPQQREYPELGLMELKIFMDSKGQEV
jgi:hypothetical protein